MAIFKRGRVYWFHFHFGDQHIQRSTKQGNPRVARQMEAAHRTRLAKGEVGIVERKPAPTLKEFAQRFIDSVQARCAEKPRTVIFYANRLDRLLEFSPLANTKLNEIDEALIQSYVQNQRSKALLSEVNRDRKRFKASTSTINRDLATLRLALRTAQDWKIIDRVPRIKLLPGERTREFVLSRKQEQEYLEITPQPLHDVALLILGTGLRVGEALALQWRDIHLDPVGSARYGYLQVRHGKTKTARRTVCLTERVREMLAARELTSGSPWVFPSKKGGPFKVNSLTHQHEKTRALMELPKDVALLVLDTGLLAGRAMKLKWEEVHLGPINGDKCGYIDIQGSKFKNASHRRNLTPRVEAILRRRSAERRNGLVFENPSREPRLVASLDSLKEFVVHSLRHTMLTRLGEAGAEAFAIMRIAGHSSVLVSQRYVHPSPESMERAFDRLEALDRQAALALPGGQNRQLPATVSATVENRTSVTH